MRKEILKSKMMLIALASILFVSCGGGGGGGGGGGSSNLPINPGTPSVPSTPSTPSTPEDSFPTVTNPLDSQKGNMSALKASLYAAQVASNTTIPEDTTEVDGSGVKVAVLDADFRNEIRSTAKDKEGRTEDVRRSKTLEDVYNSSDIYIISRINSNIPGATNNIDYTKNGENITAGILPNKETYDAALNALRGESVKIFNQSFGSEKSYDDPSLAQYRNEGDSMLLYFNQVGSSTTEEKQIPYFRDVVQNKGGLFIWAAGNDGSKNSTLDAGLPYFDEKLEKGWISVVGVQEEGLKKINGQYEKTGKYNVMADGTEGVEELSSAGFYARYWSISADAYGVDRITNVNITPDGRRFIRSKTGYGSSYAAPKVTRAAALVYAKFDWMTADQIRQTLFTTTDKTDLSQDPENMSERDLRNVTRTPDITYGWGMLNQERALKGPGAFMNVSSNSSASKVFKANLPWINTVAYFENDIYGDGSLEKLGNGTLHLTGNNSFSGGSTVTTGTLEVHQIHSSAITVGKEGTLVLNPKTIVGYDVGSFELIDNINPQKITSSGIKVKNYGIVHVNGTTAIIGGDYVAYAGSVTQGNFRSGVKVLGNIKIENGNVRILSDDYITKQGSSNTVMEGKSFEGNIANIETEGMRTANVEVQDGKVVATLSRQNPVEYIGEGAEASSKNVAENVEKVFQDLDKKVLSGTATREELAMGAIVQNMTTMGFTSATEMMSGEIYASAQALTFSQAQNVNRDLSNRLAGLDNFKNSNKDSEVWFSVLGSGGKLRRDGYASADTRVTGGQFGIDTKFEGTTTLGVALNYSYAKANFNRYAGESKSNMVGVSFYGKQELPYGFYTAGRLGLSNISSKVERELLTSTGETLTGKINHHDKMLSAYIEIGKKFGWFTPFIGYSQDYLRRGSFNESEASWGIKADSKNYRATNFLVGARAEYVADKYKLQAYVTQAINTDKRDLTYEGNFTGSNVRQKYQGVKQAKNTTWVGFGVFREISPVFGVYGNVDFRVEDKKWADSVISTGLQYRF